MGRNQEYMYDRRSEFWLIAFFGLVASGMLSMFIAGGVYSLFEGTEAMEARLRHAFATVEDSFFPIALGYALVSLAVAGLSGPVHPDSKEARKSIWVALAVVLNAVLAFVVAWA